MKQISILGAGILMVAACSIQGKQGDDDGGSESGDTSGSTGSESGSTGSGTGSGSGSGSTGSGMGDANADGDCMTDAEELQIGTDPYEIDSDFDGISDCDELDCVSDPTNGAEKCYACGWKHNDPGNITSNGTSEGSVMPDFTLVDQCGDEVSMYDFAGAYHILYMTAAW